MEPLEQRTLLTATVLSVASNATAGLYSPNSSPIPITVTFSENVVVTGMPELVLNSNGNNAADSAVAKYANIGSGTSTLTFDYTVAPNDSTFGANLDYGTPATALKLNGGTIKDTVVPTPGAANLDLTGATDNLVSQNIVIDGIAPTVADVSAPPALANTSQKANSSIPITVTFSKPVTVTGTGTPELVLNSNGNNASGSAVATYTGGAVSNATTLTFNYTVTQGDDTPPLTYLNWASTSALVLGGDTITDAATNTANLDLTNATDTLLTQQITIATTPPVVQSVTPNSNSLPTVNGLPTINSLDKGTDTFLLEVTYDASMDQTTAPTITLPSSTNTTLTLDSASGFWASNTTYYAYYNVAVPSGGVSVPSVDVKVSGAQDLAGNVQTAFDDPNAFAIDTVSPTVTAFGPAAWQAPTVTSTSAKVYFVASFSKLMDPASITAASLKLTQAAGGTLNLGALTVTPKELDQQDWQFAVSGFGLGQLGTLSATIPAGNVSDVALNPTTTDATSTGSVSVDTRTVTAALGLATGQANPVTPSASGTTTINFTATLTPPVSSDSLSSLTASDVTVIQGTGSAFNGVTPTVVVTPSATNAATGPQTYNIAVSGMNIGGAVIVYIDGDVVFDSLGHQNTASNSVAVTYGPVPFTVDLEAAPNQPTTTSNSTIDFQATFTHAVASFTTSDITVSGTAFTSKTTPIVTVGVPTTDSTTGVETFTVAVSGMDTDGTVTAVITSGALILDNATQTATVTPPTNNTVNYKYGPTVTIDGPSLPSASPITFTVVFSQAVTDFTAAAVTVDVTSAGNTAFQFPAGVTVPAGVASPKPIVTVGAPTTNASTGAQTYLVTVSGMVVDGTVNATIAAGVAHTASGAGNAQSTSTNGDNTVNYVGPLTLNIVQPTTQALTPDNLPVYFVVKSTQPVVNLNGAITLTTGGSATGTPSYTVGTPSYDATTSTYDYNVAVTGLTGDGTVTATIPIGAAHDLTALAANIAAATLTVPLAPTVTIDKATAQTDPTSTSPVNFTVVFSQAVTDFNANDVNVDVTTAGNAFVQDDVYNSYYNTTSTVTAAPIVVVTDSGDHMTYNVAVSGMNAYGKVTATIPAGVVHNGDTTPVANFPSTSTNNDNSVTYSLPLTVTIDRAAGQADPASGTAIHFTAVFNEPVTNFTAANVTLDPSSAAGATVQAPVSQDGGVGKTWDVVVKGMTDSGTVAVSIAAGVVAAKADATQINAASTSTNNDNSVTYTYIAPSATDPTVTVTAPTSAVSGSSVNFTVHFADSTGAPVAVTGFTTANVASEVSIGGTAAGALLALVNGSGADYTVTVYGITGDGTVTLSVLANAAQDASGRGNLATTAPATATVVPIDPTVKVTPPVTGTANGSKLTFTVQFSEAVTGFTSDGVTLGGTAAGPLSAVVTDTGDHQNYTVAVSGMNGTGTVTVGIAAGAAKDAAGNLSSVSNIATVTFNCDTVGLYDPTTPVFDLKNSNSAGSPDATIPASWAAAGWIPVAGDWDNNGSDTIGFYNPTTSQWYLKNSNDAIPPGLGDVPTFMYGPANSKLLPIAGDWDGNGTVTVGLYDPASSMFFLKNSNTTGFADTVFMFGPANSGMVPIAGNWTGTGKADGVGLYSSSLSMFFLKNSNTSGFADTPFVYGPANSGMVPVAGDWNGDGMDTIGLYSPSSSQWFLRNSNTTGFSDEPVFVYGPANASPAWIPLAGNWTGTLPVATAATITGVSSTTAAGTYGAGTSIPITVTYSSAVTVMGTPTLALNSNGSNASAVATYKSTSSDGLTLTFTYTVAAGDGTASGKFLDYTSTTVTLPSGSSIVDKAAPTTNADLTLPAAAGANDGLAAQQIVIGVAAPTITGVSSTATAGAPGAVIPITVTFSDPVTVTGTPKLALNSKGSNASAVATYSSGSGTATLTFNYTVAAGDSTASGTVLDYTSTAVNLPSGSSIVDTATPTTNATLTLPAAGSTNDGLAAQKIVIGASPTVTEVSSTATTGTTGTVIPITVTFSAPVTVSTTGGAPTLALNSKGTNAIATATYNSISADGLTLTFNYTVTAGDASSDLDYTSTTALALNNGTIVDTAVPATAATLTLPAPGSTNDGLAAQQIVVGPEMAVNQVTPAANVTALTQAQLQPIVEQAIANWAKAGLNASALAKLEQAQFVISDLPGSYLGETAGTHVSLDANAAGHGWFVDPTPASDAEFAAVAGSHALQAVNANAVDKIDLLTVVEHELGHVAGLSDNNVPDDVMDGVLGVGVRRDVSAVDAALAD
jgi:hypothetical protein